MLKQCLILPVYSFITCFFLVHGTAVAAILQGGQIGDEQTTIGYDAATGEIFVATPISTQLTSIRLASMGAIFTGAPADHLALAPDGFDIDEDDVIFKSTIGSSFGSISFGNVAQPGFPQAFLLDDLDVTGSLAGGGGLGPVDFIFVPEPSVISLAIIGVLALGFVVRAERKLER
jgi:hypothetical protein